MVYVKLPSGISTIPVKDEDENEEEEEAVSETSTVNGETTRNNGDITKNSTETTSLRRSIRQSLRQMKKTVGFRFRKAFMKSAMRETAFATIMNWPGTKSIYMISKSVKRL